jgi:hypothetical protein
MECSGKDEHEDRRRGQQERGTKDEQVEAREQRDRDGGAQAKARS